MKKYETPDVELLLFALGDVLAASDEGEMTVDPFDDENLNV